MLLPCDLQVGGYLALRAPIRDNPVKTNQIPRHIPPPPVASHPTLLFFAGVCEALGGGSACLETSSCVVCHTDATSPALYSILFQSIGDCKPSRYCCGTACICPALFTQLASCHLAPSSLSCESLSRATASRTLTPALYFPSQVSQ